MPTLKERVDKHDREFAAIKKLILAGMKTLSRMEERFEIDMAAAREEMREMRAYQRETARQLRELGEKVDRVVSSIERGEGNGHKKTRIE